MPAWWGRKSHKTSKERSIDTTTNTKNCKNKEKAKSFDESLISPRTPKDSSPSSSSPAIVTSSSCDSDFEKRGHPLPRPSISSAPSLVHDHGVVALGSASVSVSSSVSSSASSDDPNPDFGFSNLYRRQSPRARSPRARSPRARSPGPGSRGLTVPSSPLHPRLCGMSLESLTGKQEDGSRSPCHPLPLPPGSPTKACTSPSSIKSFGSIENSQFLRPIWKRGRLLGRGTFGHVYLGFNSEKGKFCAIKEVKLISDDQSSKESLKQLNQEINLLGQLSHSNIVQYYGSELGEDTLSVYLEFVSGGSIHKLLQEYGAFNEPVIQNYTRQILLGLSYLHGRNTVHRDIKGANILVDPNGEIKLADFGMAKHITSHTSMLSFKGSPYWMAPEVIMNSSGYSLAVDIWSLGCTILEMATSKPPWSQYEGVAAIFKIGNSKDIPEIPEHLSNDAKSFLTLCLQREPSARPTATQLLEHPFIRDQATTKVPKMNITNDAFTSSFDGSHTPTTLDFHFNKTNIIRHDGDKGMRVMVPASRAVKNTRDPPRLNMSLPVSPTSSPLRQYGPAHRSCFLSPPHPAYVLVGQNGYGQNNQHPFLSTRQYMSHPVDQWLDISQPNTETPGRSPRTRAM